LEELEAELESLKRELLSEAAPASILPTGDFQCLRVVVSEDLFGIPIESVREIVRYVQLTRVTDVPVVVQGAINVRGEVFAVIDARRRFGYQTLKPGPRTSIVLTEARGKISGLIVDRVADVVTVTPGSLRAPTGVLASARCVAAISTIDDQMMQILDLGLMLSVREWHAVVHALSERPSATAAESAPDSGWDGGDE
jgi:purine-binding chemotaxis protein CheW